MARSRKKRNRGSGGSGGRGSRMNRGCDADNPNNMYYNTGECCSGGTYWNGTSDIQCSNLGCPLCGGDGTPCYVTDACPGRIDYCRKYGKHHPKCMQQYDEPQIRRKGGRVNTTNRFSGRTQTNPKGKSKK